MSSLRVRDVDIQFPFNPYPCQKIYMEKVLECLEEEKNGILESPTGTGKTLSLLCAALAWQNSLKSADSPLGEEDVESRPFRAAIPTVIYASRTHSQLSQAVQELKRTQYRPNVVTLGSRDHLCVNPRVMAACSNTEKVYLCKASVQSRSCSFYNNLEGNSARFVPLMSRQQIADIEDLGRVGSKHGVCPYYLVRDLAAKAELVFMPYSYLLDVKLRATCGINLEGSVVIIDEAHNVEQVCEESSSFDFSLADVASCLEDVNKCIDINRKEAETSAVLKMNSDHKKWLDHFQDGMYLVKAVLVNLQYAIKEIEINKGEDGLTKPGSFMVELFKRCQLQKHNYLSVLESCEQMLSLAGKSHRSFSLKKFADVIKVVFQPFEESLSCYKVHISENKKKADKSDCTLSFWCFSPGHAMRGLSALGVRCIILTSGTLYPLSSFAAQLEIPFPVTVGNQHVIEGHQVFTGVVMSGCDDVKLDSSYENRFSFAYINSLGKSLVRLAGTVPNGLLVFFPSYLLMYKCVESWQQIGLWNELGQVKPIFLEPKDKKDFSEAIDGFYKKIREPDCQAAIFLAVCRGKAAEGLDFTDANGRAVIVTGIPFLPTKDAKVKLKMAYLNEIAHKEEHLSLATLTGAEWYCQQALRAVNQAIGRVVRHRHDFGAILLCDSRFAGKDIQGRLAKWVRTSVQTYANFENLCTDLKTFFAYAQRMLPSPKPKQSLNSLEKVEHSHQQIQNLKSPVKSTLSAQPSKIKLKDTEAVCQKMMESKAYHKEIKKALGSEGDKEFASLLRKYKQSSDLDSLLSGLFDLFDDCLQVDRLLEGLEKFLKKNHREPYRKSCLEFCSAKAKKTATSACKEIAVVEEELSVEPSSKKHAFEIGRASDPIVSGSPMKAASSAVVPPKPDVVCPVCKKRPQRPLEGPCKHTCCGGCWRESLKEAKKCPVCGRSVRSKQLKKIWFYSLS